jgi:hypothetical protein
MQDLRARGLRARGADGGEHAQHIHQQAKPRRARRPQREHLGARERVGRRPRPQQRPHRRRLLPCSENTCKQVGAATRRMKSTKIGSAFRVLRYPGFHASANDQADANRG